MPLPYNVHLFNTPTFAVTVGVPPVLRHSAGTSVGKEEPGTILATTAVGTIASEFQELATLPGRPTVCQEESKTNTWRVFMKSSRSLWLKRGTVIAMCLCMILAACSKQPPPQTTGEPESTQTVATLPAVSSKPAVTITFAAPRYTLPAYEALAEVFNATHDFRITVRDISDVRGDWGQFSPTPEMLNELASNVDTFVLPESSLTVGLASNSLLDLTPLAESDPDFAPDDFFPGFLARFEDRGSLWGLPASAGSIFILYDTALFDHVRVAHPSPGWTWDDFLRAAEQLTAGEGDTKRFGFFDAWGNQAVISFIQQHGGDLVVQTGSGPMPALDDPLSVEAVRWYLDLALQHGVSPRPSDVAPMPPREFTREHHIAMWTDTLDNWPLWAQELRGQVGVAPFPDDLKAANPVMLNGYFVSPGTSHPQECWQWVSFLTRQPVTDESMGRLPVRRSVFEASEYSAWMGVENEAAVRYTLTHPAPPMTDYDIIVIDALFQALDAVWSGGATVEEALAQAQAEAEEKIAQAVARNASLPTPPAVLPVPSPTPDRSAVSVSFLVSEVLDQEPYRVLAVQFSQDHPGVNVVVSSGSLSSFSEAAGSADCFLWPTFSRPDDWKQHVAPLDPFLQNAQDFTSDALYPQGLADLSDEGKLWGMPLFVEPDLIYFNKDLFDAAGTPYPAAGWLWDDFVATARALTKGDGSSKQYGFVPRAAAAPEALAFIAQHGASPVDDPDNPTRPTFDTPGVIESLAWYADLAHAYHVVPPLWTSDDPSVADSKRHALIHSGRVAMWTDSPWPGDPGYDFDWGAVPLPGDRRFATDFDTWAAYTSVYSPHPAGCWEWSYYLSTHLTTGSGIPARRSLAEAIPLTPEQTAVLASMNHENTRINRWRDPTRWTGWVYPWFQNAVRDILSGRASVSQAMEQTQSRAERFLLCLETPGDLSRDEAMTCALQVDPDYPVSFSGSR